MATQLSDQERARLESALTAVCRQGRIDPAGARLVRYTMNAVYELPAAGVVIRMAAGPQARARAVRVAQIAAAFAERGMPTVRLATGLGEPIHADGWSATVWEFLPQPPEHRIAPAALVAPLRAIHAAGAPFELPLWDPVSKARNRVAQVETLDAASRSELQRWATVVVGLSLDQIMSQLRQRADELAAAVKAAEWTLPQSVIHGDAHTGNLLLDRDGAAVICDLDSVAVGPPEWDLVPTAHGAARFGDNPSRHRALADAYGLDVTTCPAWETLRQIRELQLMTSVIANLAGRPDVADEAGHRLRTGLVDNHGVTWHRYR
ncbi:phosphotransferase enzyme family protein [Phytohabitans aurantiacus]|uniref:Aminoglycoside phosphotransferase n=1 Tax=Phytohabitans aurantiacus TaxID=3016789 RepID=A0ABQ5RB65_9ACTN|nr:aminoglycoside phosphotransferase family protein [Phytohabitans aurantiacus]GLI03900.1 aminoglycoside phosphotransferase [Phytohabitans aurantiacus]